MRGLLLAAALSSAIACDRSGAAADDKTAATRQQLVGTWREAGGQTREYVLEGAGTFTMKMNPSGCADGRAADAVTASGAWSVRDGSLVLDVKITSDPMFANSTMRDAIRELTASSLVLESSVAGCVGQRVRLSKQ